MSEQEEWRPIEGYDPVYEVSSLGGIRSVRRKGSKGGPMKTTPRGPYPAVHLRVDGRTEFVRVHVLVARAFLPPPEEGQTLVRHLDDDVMNPAASNLAWGDKRLNGLDAVRNGRNREVLKTACPSGHAYDEENTRWYRGQRFCRRCGGWSGK